MFLKGLNDDEKKAFLELAYMTARADRILAMEEYDLWKRFRWELGLPDEKYSVKDMPMAEAAALFTTERTKRGALLELAGMVLADGVVAPEEERFLTRLGEAFGLPDEVVGECLAWARQLADIMRAGKRIADGDTARNLI